MRTAITPRFRTSRRRLTRRVGALAIASLVVLAACGDDDDGATGDVVSTVDPGTADPAEVPTETTGIPTDLGDPIGGPAPGSASVEACDAFVAVSEQLAAGDPEAMAAALDEMSATIPERWAEQAATVVEGFTAAFAGDDTAMQNAPFVSALGYVSGFYVDSCDLDTKLEVTGEDYAFTGIPAEVTAGRLGLRLVNLSASSEPHELVILRRPGGDERTIADIAALDPDTLFTDYEMVGVAFAEVPAAMMSIVVDIEPGEYVAICNLPVAGEEASTHAHEGMVVAFTAA